ncbi:MAG: hypothetical protein R3B06_32280 [Kofleriaceae bacterium]
MACPYCASELMPTPPAFTWWGGVIGAKLLHHAICPACRRGYNERTGRPNTRAIAVYMVVTATLIGGLMWLLYRG